LSPLKNEHFYISAKQIFWKIFKFGVRYSNRGVYRFGYVVFDSVKSVNSPTSFQRSIISKFSIKVIKSIKRQLVKSVRRQSVKSVNKTMSL
jgi:hypothetical protein